MRRFLIASMVLSVFILLLTPSGSALLAGQEAPEPGKKVEAELPPAVAQAVKANCPGAVIGKIDLEKDAGIALYDIEFKAGRGEIEVAADGTVMDVATIVTLKDIPMPAAQAIEKAAAGATIGQVEKSEVRAEVKKVGEKGTIVKLSPPKYVYEAELAKDGKKAEVRVAPDGKVIEAPEWGAGEANEKEEMTRKKEDQEKEEAEEKEEAQEKEARGGKPGAPADDLKILPPAVLNAFRASYPKAVIRGASKEIEKGVTYYEVESVDGKMNRDLLYTADGKAVEVEETIAPGALPPAVLQALAKAYPGFKISKAENLLREGRRLFEIQLRAQDKKLSVTVDPSGKIIQ
jgi:uncharacterized membrane protein YkoI